MTHDGQGNRLATTEWMTVHKETFTPAIQAVLKGFGWTAERPDDFATWVRFWIAFENVPLIARARDGDLGFTATPNTYTVAELKEAAALLSAGVPA